MAETESERVKVSFALSGRRRLGSKKSQRRVEKRLLKTGLCRMYPPDGCIPAANSLPPKPSTEEPVDVVGTSICCQEPHSSINRLLPSMNSFTAASRTGHHLTNTTDVISCADCLRWHMT